MTPMNATVDVLADQIKKLHESWNDWDADYTVGGNTLITLLNTFDELLAERKRHVEALGDIKTILGPLPIPSCCDGAKAEMEVALSIATKALTAKPEAK